MKKAMEFLAANRIDVSKDGSIISVLPDGIKGIGLVNDLEEHTQTESFCYTIINNRLEKIEI